ncbi:MAG: hypothetical protein BWK73_49865 [Thiothrix lacustris]|uniref:Uncharacterized protein n=1 Tax=Thiothrix lacustris TaxID=525917 RepID=A0A1Y1Q8Z4_9GAMM|nr:MAG: hypothetical protein BWK73_49865 [Thiothrix lacustris]
MKINKNLFNSIKNNELLFAYGVVVILSYLFGMNLLWLIYPYKLARGKFGKWDAAKWSLLSTGDVF